MDMFFQNYPKSVCLLLTQELLCTCKARKVWALMNWILCEHPGPRHGLDRKWRSADKRGSTSKCSRSRFIRDSAITWGNVSRSIACQAWQRAQIFIWMDQLSRTTVDKKMGRKLNARRIITYHLSYQNCHHLPAAVPPLHRNHRIRQIILENPNQFHQIQW